MDVPPQVPADAATMTGDAVKGDVVVEPSDEPTAVLLIGRYPVPEPSDQPAGPAAPTPAPTPRSPLLRLASPRVVALAPHSTPDGYRSVHSTLTRTGLRSVLRTAGRALAEAAVTFGVVALLFAAYEVWGAPQVIYAHQRDLDRQLAQEWGSTGATDPTADPSAPSSPAAPPPLTPPPGNALARLYLPRLDKYWVVVEGVEPNDLRLGPGHYPASAKPGQIGNFAVAGHRSPGVFWDLDTMHNGDPVVLETASSWYVYRVTKVQITSPYAVEEVAPVPGDPGATPTTAMLTLTTCNPKWDNTQRLIVHARLVRQSPRSAGRPAELPAR